MSAKEALEKLDQIDTKYSKIYTLRQKANELIESHIPLIWKDGDTRYLSPEIFNILKGYSTQLAELEGNFVSNTRLYYIGQFGTLNLEEAK